jgi:ribosomal protein S18 acetylase RimI-like enzyme
MAIIEYIRELKYKWITLEVPVENKQAQHVYEKLGFKYTGETIEDSLKLMKLKLK